ncbi:MAG TPA: dTDP-4-dehydrorhamnose 3,5-epimerase family protein [Candidatus Polarisedimenticolaceae bacterium]|nr:dTDP-4-dehydrorhamnose 3,5-epimerase family protein [Candidatus Polarisedimenticolaceae bacterium]
MRIEPAGLPGVFVVHLEPESDGRGHFARLWDARTLAEAGLSASIAQASLSWNARRHTLRGLHWQVAPHAEAKLVRCSRGAIFDVAVDVRPGSSTERQWVGLHLSAREPRALYLTEGLAHGFLTLEDDTEVSYLISSPHVPHAGRGARYDDPAFAIAWPAPPAVIADRDRSFPSYDRGPR